ncbi:hypothetical protein [Polymorphobacter fuscus]|uniref:hypothetical protein n=1 Tax=Sandarakinorhabdus fusca TaxID=1439888 RepID=UPI001A9C71BF|nr:hypothetical protein [Polymorphobacter fuscus]
MAAGGTRDGPASRRWHGRAKRAFGVVQWCTGLALAAAVAPAAAQIPPKLSALCPKAAPGEIVVCADTDPPKSPYRLPLPMERDRGDPNAVSVSRERNGLFDYDAGGIGSCGVAGAGGNFGCGMRKHKAWVEQRAGAPAGGGWLFSEPAK